MNKIISYTTNFQQGTNFQQWLSKNSVFLCGKKYQTTEAHRGNAQRHTERNSNTIYLFGHPLRETIKNPLCAFAPLRETIKDSLCVFAPLRETRNAIAKTIMLLLLAFNVHSLISQTTISPGNISGQWTKKGSPYTLTGDVNIPYNQRLEIEPGVEVLVKSGFKINVQGSLVAKGTASDSILFTLADTTALESKGWNGIRFDARPVAWDTVFFKMPAREIFRQHALERIKKGELDTLARITVNLVYPDLVNDTLLADSIFKCDSGSILSWCRFEYAAPVNKQQPYFFGGAVYIYRYSNLLITNCTFENNKAIAGGAIYCKEAAPVIMRNRIINNRAESSAGAISFIYSGAIVLENEFVNNISGYNGGALLFHESCPYVCNNTLLNNKAGNHGGGLYFEKDKHHILFDGTTLPGEKPGFTRNLKVNEKEISSGIVKKATNSNGRFINNVVCNNSAKAGGGIGIIEASPELVNNTIANNTTENQGGGVSCINSSPSFINTIIYANNAGKGNGQVYLYGSSSPSLGFCNIPSGTTGVACDTVFDGYIDLYDNIHDAPVFEDPGKNNFYLEANSPCIDAGQTNLDDQLVYISDNRGKNRKYNNLIDIGAIEFLGKKGKTKDAGSKDKENPGNEGLSEMAISVYPNPVSDRLSVEIHNNTYEKIVVDIYNQGGQKVLIKEYKSGAWFSEKINISSLGAGTYILVIHAGDEILYNNRIIKE